MVEIEQYTVHVHTVGEVDDIGPFMQVVKKLIQSGNVKWCAEQIDGMSGRTVLGKRYVFLNII